MGCGCCRTLTYWLEPDFSVWGVSEGDESEGESVSDLGESSDSQASDSDVVGRDPGATGTQVGRLDGRRLSSASSSSSGGSDFLFDPVARRESQGVAQPLAQSDVGSGTIAPALHLSGQPVDGLSLPARVDRLEVVVALGGDRLSRAMEGNAQLANGLAELDGLLADWDEDTDEAGEIRASLQKLRVNVLGKLYQGSDGQPATT